MENLTRKRDGYWRMTSKRTPIEEDVVLGMFNEWESLWLFRCFTDRGYVPVCAASTTQPDSIYVSDFSWLPRFHEHGWHTEPPPDEEPVVGFRRNSEVPEMLCYVSGHYRAVDIGFGVDDESEVVDCIKWIDLPEAPPPRTKTAKKRALRLVN